MINRMPRPHLFVDYILCPHLNLDWTTPSAMSKGAFGQHNISAPVLCQGMNWEIQMCTLPSKCIFGQPHPKTKNMEKLEWEDYKRRDIWMRQK